MPSRHSFIKGSFLVGAPATSSQSASPALTRPGAVDGIGQDAQAVATDERYWRDVQQAYTLDRTIINLNNGGVSSPPRVAHEALLRWLDAANQAPAYHMWRLQEPGIETVRRDLAREFGCDPEEMAITRNASEALQIVQLGIDLEPGDEIVTTNQDYGRMLDTWAQRARRTRVRVIRLAFPVPARSADLIRLFERAITSRTRIFHFCHVTARTGQVFPVRALCELARRRGIRTIVDGAHGFAHLPFKVTDLGCDCYATSLHKWLQAPVGNGSLYVRRPLIREIWPLQPAAPNLRDDIRKFEEIGTHPAAFHHAIAEALAFHRGIGIERKLARLRYLRDRWLEPIGRHPRVRVFSPQDRDACAIGSIGVRGLEPEQVTERLWEDHRIMILPIWHRQYRGIRITPAVSTTLGEIDTFVEAMQEILRRPAAGATPRPRPGGPDRELDGAAEGIT